MEHAVSVWMRKGEEEPVRVPEKDISDKMWAGYKQCDPPAPEKPHHEKKESK